MRTGESNREKSVNGLMFEQEVFDLLKKNNILYITKQRYPIKIRRGSINVEPDITLSDPFTLISVKRSIRERWKQDVPYQFIHGVKKIMLVTQEAKYPKACHEFYDNVFVFPQDEDKFVQMLKHGVVRNTLDFWWNKPSNSDGQSE